MTIITEDALEYIRKHSSLTAAQLRKDILKKFGVDISEAAVYAHMHKAREIAEEATRCTDVHISKKISERVDEKVIDLLEMMEGEIVELHACLQGKSDKIEIHKDIDPNGNPTDHMFIRDYIAVEKSFQDSIKNYIALRPQVQTVKIEGLGSRTAEEEFLKSLSDEELAALEAISKKREKMDKGPE